MPGKTRFRFMAIAILAVLAVTLGVALPGVSADGGDDKVAPIPRSGGTSGDNQAPPIPEKAELNYPNLGSHLDELVTGVEEGQATSKDAAVETPVHSGESVAVTIYLTDNVDAVVSFLEDSGGDPRNVGEDYIEAYVPVTLLGRLSEQPGVIRVREIIPPEPDYGPVTSQGVQGHAATVWHQAGYSGQGVKLGIIDTGFEGFSGLMGTELPPTVRARCYTDIGVFSDELADCEIDGVHGNASTETVIDIAPAVSLYLTNPQSHADMRDAVNWMISEDVSVINASISWWFDGPGDGTSPYTTGLVNTVDRAVEDDIVWVTSAGNSARHTWFGIFSDSDKNGRLNFQGFEERNFLRIGDGTSLLDYPFAVDLRWEDNWVLEDGTLGGAASNLDVFVVDGATNNIVASGRDPQSGGVGHIPQELFGLRRFNEPPTGSSYYILVSLVEGEAPDWVQLTLNHSGPELQYHTLQGSIKNPAEGKNLGMLAVGAAHYWNTHTIADYSSRGPTPDGRVKPDIVGTACGETASHEPHLRDENNCWFAGTSQASPHVAGLAALVRQRFPDYTPAQVASYLKDFAQQRETPDPNYTWGHGFAQLPSPDREALVALYNATGGANWTNNTNWLTTAPIGQWRGVTTDSQGRVTELNLTSNQLKGGIPPELADLTSLKLLGLGGNELTGPIPTWLGSLTNLEELHLWENDLTGTIPAELGRLSNLEVLSLSGNQLAGQMPAELGNLTDLVELGLADNQLTGGIPPELENLSNLQELYLWSNRLTGTIPSELGSLTKLQQLSLSDNQLTGAIPTWLGSLTKLEELSLWGNGLMGTIPSELARLISLEILALGDNRLTGKIPAELASLTKLEELSLTSNQLTGAIPTWLGTLTELEDLRLWGNELSGEIPTELGSLTNLKELHLNSNQLTGEIPAELARLTKLEDLRLWGNELSGEIPAEMGRLSNLEQLHLSSNQLTGEIPTELGRLSNLEQLSLSRNQLTGQIPTEVGRLSKLALLSLSSNQLSGNIPEELGILTNLEELYLWGNRLSGMVPETLVGLTLLERFVFHHNPSLCAPIDDAFQTWLRGISTVLGSSCAPADSPEDRAVLVQVHSATDGANWTNNTNWLSERFTREWYGVTNDTNGRVHGLFLGSNQLTGKIPFELGGLTKLEWLYLNYNQLTGGIPAELGDLANLRVLSLMDNQLTGEIPAELGRLTNLTVLHLAGNQLTGCVPDDLRDVADNDFAQLGLPFCPPYDANGDGAIDIGELFSAIDDYFAGLIGIGELFAIIDLYFLDPT